MIDSDSPAATIATMANLENSGVSDVLFVYAWRGKVRCLTHAEATAIAPSLLAEGWQHTATIQPARWIESLCMGYGDPSDLIDELQFSPAIAQPKTPPSATEQKP